MKKSILLILILLAASLSVFAQNYEYGQTSDLKDLKKVFVETGGDLKDRERIIGEIEKAALALVVVDSLEEAEIVLSFGGGKSEIVSGATTTPVYGTNNTMTTVNRRKVAVGSGNVFVKGKRADVPRIVMNFESTQDKFGEKKPATKFAKEFIKKYKEANGLK